ncbi:MAG TPA: radical SAM family heme chaperone HemW [Phycisphaerales bacterium]|nr:radical SAM family heme chaperone HemW [Phycisphaerales bacterium]
MAAARSSAREVLGERSPGAPARSLYVHVPFCFHKCHYCDFYSIVDTRDRQGAFADRLVRELAALAPHAAGAPLRTIFVGGGTPTLLAAPLWERVLRCLAERYDLTEILAGRGEFTVECNPETATPALFDVLRAGGVDRLSVGAQTFDPRHLKTLERWHNPDNVFRAIALARAAGIGRQSLDIIYGIPGQTMEDLDRDLFLALSAGTEHVSAYALTYEPATAMTARRDRGDFPGADEDLEAMMFERVLGTMRAAGLDRYEVSNFARPGAESRHNLAYWRNEDWLAAGPSASGHLRGARWKNAPRLDDYLAHDDEGFAPIVDHERPDPRRAVVERLMMGLRLREGVDSASVLDAASRLSPPRDERLSTAATEQARLGLLRDAGGRWTLTDDGFLLTNRVVAALADALD